MLTFSAALEDFSCPFPHLLAWMGASSICPQIMSMKMVWRRNVCALLSPWRCRQVSLSCVSFLQLCCPAFYVFLYLCLPHHILTLCTKIRKVVGLSTHPLPRILNISSHLIKPLQTYRVVINMPAFPVKKQRHGGIKGVTQASSS